MHLDEDEVLPSVGEWFQQLDGAIIAPMYHATPVEVMDGDIWCV